MWAGWLYRTPYSEHNTLALIFLNSYEIINEQGAIHFHPPQGPRVSTQQYYEQRHCLEKLPARLSSGLPLRPQSSGTFAHDSCHVGFS